MFYTLINVSSPCTSTIEGCQKNYPVNIVNHLLLKGINKLVFYVMTFSGGVIFSYIFLLPLLGSLYFAHGSLGYTTNEIPNLGFSAV